MRRRYEKEDYGKLGILRLRELEGYGKEAERLRKGEGITIGRTMYEKLMGLSTLTAEDLHYVFMIDL